MAEMLIIQTTTQELKEQILDGIKLELEEIKSSFQPKQPTVYLTRKDVSDLLQIDISTVHNWTKKGKLRAYGIGNRVYFKRTEIEAAFTELK